jgi:23S rRNA (cytosine1962-C5)-methyltransferase
MDAVAKPVVSAAPSVMRTGGWSDYELLDSGGGRKLERYGPYRVVRPEPQCMWAPRAAESEWASADAIFDAAGDEDEGRWRYAGAPKPAWPMAWRDVRFCGRFTAFRHLGFFPEQAANWAWLDQRLRGSATPPRVLNLFGYTGVASLVCAAAGAAVTHVDASKKAIGWARENAELSGLTERPIRWICEDAVRYVQREVRRGAQYDGIILDPPKYGRGPAGEVWRLFEDLPRLLPLCVDLLAPDASFLILNAYAERVSGSSLASLLADSMAGRGGGIEWGELALVEQGGERAVGLSFFARWSGE